MKIGNWTEITEAGSFTRLPVGGYVMKIVDAKDNPKNEYLEIVYDIAEGEYADHYAGEEDWRHNKRRYYSEKSKGFFKAFLSRLEESNNGRFTIAEWQRTCDEKRLIGLLFGGVMQERMYTNDKGEDKTILELTDRFYSAQDIRNGDFTIPKPNDQRREVAPKTPAEYYDEPIPF